MHQGSKIVVYTVHNSWGSCCLIAVFPVIHIKRYRGQMICGTYEIQTIHNTGSSFKVFFQNDFLIKGTGKRDRICKNIVPFFSVTFSDQQIPGVVPIQMEKTERERLFLVR